MKQANVIYVGGTFDLFHVGHVELLREASKFGQVVVALNNDEFVERYKGKKPVMPFNERAELVASCRYVGLVIENSGNEDSKKTIEELESKSNDEVTIKVIGIAHGTDWTGDSLFKQMGLTQEWLDEKKISMIYIPRTTGQSTTKLKDETRNSNNNVQK